MYGKMVAAIKVGKWILQILGKKQLILNELSLPSKLFFTGIIGLVKEVSFVLKQKKEEHDPRSPNQEYLV